MVRLLRSCGLNAERVPLSGSASPGRPDVCVGELTISVKYGKACPEILYKHAMFWLDEFLVVPLWPWLIGACEAHRELPRLQAPKSVEGELSRCRVLIGRTKGQEWKAVGKVEDLAKLRRCA